MLMNDADFMLSLKNDLTTREFAIVTHDEIDRESHYKWLEEHLGEFQVMGNNIGAIRIEDNEISIWIAKEHRGKGIASYILRLVSRIGMKAKIVDGNIASMRCFINASFKPIDHKDNYYIFQL